jgi:Xaa-Pro aminopeptidase
MIGRVGSSIALAFVLSGLAAPAAAQIGSPAGPVPVERLAARRAALMERLGQGVAILRSADPRDIEGDYPQDSDYREDNDFFYLTGLEAPGGWLVLAAGQGGESKMVLYLPARDPAMERWTGPQLGPGPEAVRLTGIGEVRPVERLADDLRALAATPGTPLESGVYLKSDNGRLCTRLQVVAGGCAELLGVSANGGNAGGAGRGAGRGAAKRSDGEPRTARDLRPHLAALRLVKDEDELRRLRRSIDITTEAQRAAMRAMEPGLWEYEIEALIEYTFRRRGAERVGFPSIVGSGPNSTILHYDKSRRQMEAGDLVVMDIGSEYGYFSADVTRTVPVSGKFTPRQRAIYELVLGAQEAALAATRPGVMIGELNRIARAYIRDNSGDLCGETTCDHYFVHGLSHWLGMDVHDVGDYETPLAPGMVITIEPGIYLTEESLGVRIEDDVLVTDSGAELLSAAAPRTVEEIERVMAEGRRPLP